MSAYQTLVVGTDGSDSSLRAVDRAGAIAADYGAKLIVATAYFHAGYTRGSWGRAARRMLPKPRPQGRELPIVGHAPTYEILREARDRAKAAGARNIEERAIVGDAVHALLGLAEEVNADLLVVGNVGLTALSGGCSDRSRPTFPIVPRSTC